jgi:hypothetical protein
MREAQGDALAQRRGDAFRSRRSAEIVVGDDRQRLSEGSVAVVSANAPHDVYNVSSEALRMITGFPSAAVVTTADQSVEPGGRRVFVTAPEE